MLVIVQHCMDALACRPHPAPVRELPHIKKLDDRLGQFLVRVTCPCGASRQIEPEALVGIEGRSVTFAALAIRCDAHSAGRKLPRWSQLRGRGGAEEFPLVSNEQPGKVSALVRSDRPELIADRAVRLDWQIID